jgi:hypothetical protein
LVARWVDKLAAMRGPSASLKDVIIRLAAEHG